MMQIPYNMKDKDNILIVTTNVRTLCVSVLNTVPSKDDDGILYKLWVGWITVYFYISPFHYILRDE